MASFRSISVSGASRNCGPGNQLPSDLPADQVVRPGVTSRRRSRDSKVACRHPGDYPAARQIIYDHCARKPESGGA
jgi:hypothetical protein